MYVSIIHIITIYNDIKYISSIHVSNIHVSYIFHRYIYVMNIINIHVFNFSLYITTYILYNIYNLILILMNFLYLFISFIKTLKYHIICLHCFGFCLGKGTAIWKYKLFCLFIYIYKRPEFLIIISNCIVFFLNNYYYV